MTDKPVPPLSLPASKKEAEEIHLYPPGFKIKSLPAHLKPQKFNSTSTLFLDSTISKPKNSELIRCVAEYFNQVLQSNANIEVSDDWKRKYEIFDETKYPLTSANTSIKQPDVDVLERHVKNIFKIGQLAHESLVMAVAYLDRISENSDFRLITANWKRVTLCCLILASKVWEDQAVWNVDFLDLFPLATPYDLGQLEKKLLSLLSFDVSLRASEYAKIYFNLKAKSPSTVEHFLELQPLDKDGGTKLELRTQIYNAKHNTKVYRSTGSVDDMSALKSPRAVLS